MLPAENERRRADLANYDLKRQALYLSTYYALCIAAILANLFFLGRSTVLQDFGSFIAAGELAAAGQNPYSIDHPMVFRGLLPGSSAEASAPNLNPPISVLLFRPLAGQNPSLALTVWRLGSMALYLALVFWLMRLHARTIPPRRVAWALALAGLWSVLDLGQFYIPLVVAACGAWQLLRAQRYLWAGLLIGILVAFKPNFAIWPLFMLLAGYWQVTLAAFLSVGLLSLLPIIVYGPQIYIQWLAASAQFMSLSVPGNLSITGLTRLVLPPMIGLGLSMLLISAFALWILLRRPSALPVSGLALTVSLLASPIVWIGYTLILLPPLYESKWSPIIAASAALLAVPTGLLGLAVSRVLPIYSLTEPVYGLALLLALVAFAQRLGSTDYSEYRKTLPLPH